MKNNRLAVAAYACLFGGLIITGIPGEIVDKFVAHDYTKIDPVSSWVLIGTLVMYASLPVAYLAYRRNPRAGR